MQSKVQHFHVEPFSPFIVIYCLVSLSFVSFVFLLSCFLAFYEVEDSPCDQQRVVTCFSMGLSLSLSLSSTLCCSVLVPIISLESK